MQLSINIEALASPGPFVQVISCTTGCEAALQDCSGPHTASEIKHPVDSKQVSRAVAPQAPVVMQIVGPGNAKELFYTDSRVKQAYKNYVYMLLTRTNTYTGIQYRNDPTIFSFELMVGHAILSCTVACKFLIKLDSKVSAKAETA